MKVYKNSEGFAIYPDGGVSIQFFYHKECCIFEDPDTTPVMIILHLNSFMKKQLNEIDPKIVPFIENKLEKIISFL